MIVLSSLPIDYVTPCFTLTYIVENTAGENQLIVSGIGYESKDTFGVSFDRVIVLNNDKYKLLCKSDYNANIDLLKELCSK